jgi:flavin-dependent dehydrogenase/geranylgeranyl pyrophosphate synthase
VTRPGEAGLLAATDVLVAGAGPAGTTAAATLARKGAEVLLVGKDTRGCPADGYDVLITGQARAMLTSAGLGEKLPIRPVDVVELKFGTSVTRTICDSGAVVCDWRELRRALRGAAIQAGARYVAGTVTSLTLAAGAYQAVIDCSGRQLSARASHAVVAAGGGSTALTPPVTPHSSGLVCARRYRGVRLADHALLVLPTPAAIATSARVTCLWALPGEEDTVTIGTAYAAGAEPARPGQLMRDAVRTLMANDPRFAALRPAGPLRSQPLYAGFLPAHVARADCLLAGDAAGLVNPFTGEGLSSAVHTGLLAAQFIGSDLARPAAARRRYARRLAATFVGCFETSRHAARRYHLTWRILAAGAESDHPFFVRGRRALLLPEGPSGPVSPARLDLADPDALLLGPFLAACDEVALSVVRGEWPFLARLALAGGSRGQPWLRPATLLFAALLAAGREPQAAHGLAAYAPLGAAIELAHLGASALFGSAGPPATGRGVDWALAATLLAGDFLLAQASRLVACHSPELAWSFADWLAELAALRAGRLDPASAIPAGALFASFLEFPARMGALLGGAPPTVTRAVRDYGHHCGHAFLHAEDALAIRGMRTRLDTTLDVMLRERLSAIPDSMPGRPISREALMHDEPLRSTVLAAAGTACESSRQRALTALDAITDPAAVRILRKFAAAVSAPACPAAR